MSWANGLVHDFLEELEQNVLFRDQRMISRIQKKIFIKSDKITEN